MAKTADVLQAIWADPWFVALPADGKLVFLWAITNEHSNLAGLYVVAEETIRHETKFSSQRLERALEVVLPTMSYRPESGTVCVPSRPRHVRSKTPQIAKAIVRAVEGCSHPDIQSHYISRYCTSAWLGDLFLDLALELGISEPQRASPYLSEVHSQSQSLVVGKPLERNNGKNPRDGNPRDVEWAEWLEHYRATTGKVAKGSKPAQKEFVGRRREGRTLEELKAATVGCHGNEFCRSHHYDVPETILRASKVERYIQLAKEPERSSHPGMAQAQHFAEESRRLAEEEALAHE